MRPASYKGICRLFSVTFVFSLIILSMPPALADDGKGLAGQVEAVGTEASGSKYSVARTQLEGKMQELKKLGGGMAPFEKRLAQIDGIYSDGKEEVALGQLNSLIRSIDDQLKMIIGLRNKKRVVKKPSPVVPQQYSRVRNLTEKEIVSLVANAVAARPAVAQGGSQSSRKSYASFNGTADQYLEKVARDIINRELGGLSIPVTGPFRLERFRNVQRISELKRTGRDVRGYVDYYRRTEALASLARRDSTRVQELSSNVRYLGQQLGLNQLAGSVKIRKYR